MKIPLCERRRLETALEIQRATLALAEEQGFEHVTTEAIAERAGVSPRTFFNYYSNKEAAAVGHPPGFPDEAKAAFVRSTGPLRQDLLVILKANVEQLEERQDIIVGLGRLWRESGRVKWTIDTEIEKHAADLADCLAERTPGMDPRLRKGLADWTMRLSGLAIGRWAEGGADNLTEALDAIWEEQLEVARYLLA